DAHYSELLLRQLCLAYDPDTKAFSRYRIERDCWEKVSHQDLRKLITNELLDFARRCPDYFPPLEIKRQRVEQIIWLMEMRSDELPGQKNMIERFFAEALETCPRAELTSRELFE